MSSDDKYCVYGQKGHFSHLSTTALMTSVMAVMNLGTLLRTAPTEFLHQKHHATMADLI